MKKGLTKSQILDSYVRDINFIMKNDPIPTYPTKGMYVLNKSSSGYWLGRITNDLGGETILCHSLSYKEFYQFLKGIKLGLDLMSGINIQK